MLTRFIKIKNMVLFGHVTCGATSDLFSFMTGLIFKIFEWYINNDVLVKNNHIIFYKKILYIFSIFIKCKIIIIKVYNILCKHCW
jgi:hypothetical protein